MKKLLSTLLALVMVFATFAMLIPSATAADSDSSILYEQDFDDPALASKTNEDLAKALFGENVVDDPTTEGVNEGKTHYFGVEDTELTIEDGKLHLFNKAGGNNFEAVLATNPEIAEKGFVVEVEYEFGERVHKDGATAVDPRFFGFCPTDTIGGGDKNKLMTLVYNEAVSRTAYRESTSGTWVLLNYGPSVEASGAIGVKYKMMAVFSVTEGPALYVAPWDAAANAYGAYVQIGKFDETLTAAFAQYMKDVPGMFGNDVTLRMQHGNNTTIDNLKVYLLEEQTYNVSLNGKATDVKAVAGICDLSAYTDDSFLFAMVDGALYQSKSVIVTSDTKKIDIYTANYELLPGAAVTTGETTSLRWQATMDKAEYDAFEALLEAGQITSLEFGVIYLDNSELGRGEAPELPVAEEEVEEAAEAEGEEGEEEEAAPEVMFAIADGASESDYDDKYVFNCDSDAIAADQYNTEYASRAYFTITFADGTTITVLIDYVSNARSVAGVAVCAVNDADNGLSDAQLEKVEALAATYVAK